MAKEAHIRRRDDKIQELTLHLQTLENALKEHIQQLQNRDESLRQRDFIIAQRDRQIDKLDTNVAKYSRSTQSVFIKGAVTGLLAGLAFVLGLKFLAIF